MFKFKTALPTSWGYLHLILRKWATTSYSLFILFIFPWFILILFSKIVACLYKLECICLLWWILILANSLNLKNIRMSKMVLKVLNLFCLKLNLPKGRTAYVIVENEVIFIVFYCRIHNLLYLPILYPIFFPINHKVH